MIMFLCVDTWSLTWLSLHGFIKICPIYLDVKAAIIIMFRVTHDDCTSVLFSSDT